VWWGLGKGSVIVYYVVRVGKGQCKGILFGEDREGQRNGILCVEVSERAA
jgi:hypothetical protein